jgi:hypothetical protein
MDIFDTGVPKYRSPSCIYDGLRDLIQCEEMSLIGEMFPDVSWDRQGYIYQEKGDRLMERFLELSEYQNKLWTLEIAVWQLDQDEIHDLVFEALVNPDFARRIGFKKLFIEKMLCGNDRDYKAIITEYEEAARELNRFDSNGMAKAFHDVMKARGRDYIYRTPHPHYGNFAWYFSEKAKRLDVREEAILIAECRTLLTSYDDFLHGLKVNQALHDYLEQSFSSLQAKLKTDYDQRVHALLSVAEKHGLLAVIKADIDLELPPMQLLLEVKDVEGFESLASSD